MTMPPPVLPDDPKPRKDRVYGITHDLSGEPRVIEPKAVKVGIGLAKGKAIHVYIDLEKKWVVQVGAGNNVTRERFDKKIEAQKYHREQKAKAPKREYPSRLPYFTFYRMGADGDFEPDWGIIEDHGPVPTEIDIIFVRDDPFAASYQLWTATEKKCDGDGLNALRILSMAQGKEEEALAKQAGRNGEKWYPIVNGCWLKGCRYAKPDGDRPAPCRPMGRLLFQLLKSPRLGGTAVFNTAGYRSIQQIFSSIEIFKRTTGRGNPDKGFVSGIPLKMVLRPYRIVHNNRAATQYGVSLEFRAASALELKQLLIGHAVQYQLAGSAPLKELESGSPAHDITSREIQAAQEDNPAAIAAEFDPSAPEHPADIETAGDDEYSDTAEALDHAWDPERGDPPAQPEMSPDRITPAAARGFYEYCRARGMNDRIIADQLGRHGFEKPEEITVQALPELQLWADGYKPGQGSLI